MRQHAHVLWARPHALYFFRRCRDHDAAMAHLVPLSRALVKSVFQATNPGVDADALLAEPAPSSDGSDDATNLDAATKFVVENLLYHSYSTPQLGAATKAAKK